MSGKGREATITKVRKELREHFINHPGFSEKPFYERWFSWSTAVSPHIMEIEEVGIMIPERSSKALVAYMQKIFERDAFRESLTEPSRKCRNKIGLRFIDR